MTGLTFLIFGWKLMNRLDSQTGFLCLVYFIFLFSGLFLSNENIHANTEYDEKDALVQLSALNFQREKKVAFIDRQHNPMLKIPLEQRGKLWIRKDGTMIMRVETPHVEERQLSENYLTLVRINSRLNESVKLPSNSENVTRRIALNSKHSSHLLLLAIAALLNNNVATLQQYFELSMSKQNDSWKVRLVPINTELHAELSYMELSGESSNLQSLYVDKRNNGWQQLLINKLDALSAE